MTRVSAIAGAFALFLGLAAPLSPPLVAQDQTAQATPDEDAGFLERQIQNLLGGEGRTVQVRGLDGLLSSQASIASIEISDDDGLWLSASDITLDWRRLALLRGRLEVDALTVGSVDFQRPPLPAPAQPPALNADPEAASPFALPELPVSLDVKKFAVGDLHLGAPVVGQDARFSVDGSASLAGGEGKAALDVTRTDGPVGKFALDAGFENDTRRMFVNLDAIEDQGGIVASLSGMPGAPALSLSVAGDAPISDFEARLALATGGVDRLNGTVTIREETDSGTPAARVIGADISGDVATLFLPDYQNFFGRSVALTLKARQTPGEGLDVSQLALVTNGMALDGTLSLGPTYIPRMIDVQARLGTESGLPVVLPISGPAMLLQRANLDLSYDESSGESFSVNVTADGLQRADGLLVDHAEIVSDGTLVKSGPDRVQSVNAEVTSAITGFSHTDEALWDAVGDSFDFRALVDWADGQDLRITELDATAGDLLLSGDATVAGLQGAAPITLDADIHAAASDLSRFSAISGQSLDGKVDADLRATYEVNSGGFDVALDGQTEDLAIGEDSANDLLSGQVDLSVEATRDENGIDLSKLSLHGDSVDLAGTASIAADGWPRKVDLAGSIGAAGRAPVILPLPGPEAAMQRADLDISYDAAADDGFSAKISADGFERAGVVVGSARILADGTLARGSGGDQIAALSAKVSGDVTGYGNPDPALQQAIGENFDLDAQVDWENGAPLRITDLKAAAGDVTLAGDAQVDGLQGEEITVQSTLRAEAGDLGRFSALSGQSLTGAIATDLDASYNVANGNFDIDLNGSTRDLAVGEDSSDALLAGTIDLAVQAKRDASGTDLSKLLIKGQTIDLGGTAFLDPDGWPRRVDIAGLIGTGSGAPVVLPLSGPQASLQRARIDLNYDASQGDGYSAIIEAVDFKRDGVVIGTTRLKADGTLARADSGGGLSALTADLVAAIENASAQDPAMNRAMKDGAALNATLDWAVPDGLMTIDTLSLKSGETQLTGSAEIRDPATATTEVSGKFKLRSGSLSRFAALAGQNLNGTLNADGTVIFALANGFFSIDATATGQNLAVGIPEVDQLVRGQSTIVLKANQDEDGLVLEDVRLETPEVQVTATGGTRADGTSVDIDGRLRNVGLLAPGFNGPLVLDATATQTGDTWSIDGTADGPAGSRLNARGDVLRPDGALALDLDGRMPLGLVNGVLAPRSIQGDLAFDVAVNGPPALESVTGDLTIGGARLSDPATQLVLENLAVKVGIANSQANLDATANVSTGGQIAVSGPITLTGDIPADLTATLRNIVLVDPTLYEINLDGRITVAGPLMGGAAIGGRIDVRRSEIKIPSSFGGPSAVPEITHVGEPAKSVETRRRAGLVRDEPEKAASGGGPVYPLNITISAPQEIFIRGRGLDVEMGGEVTVTGTTANPITAGGLQLIRGRMDLLSQRLDFEEATISLQGDFKPYIRMVAVSNNGSITAMIIIEGPIDKPEISLTSEPELPEDEVLAQLFFGKPVSQLSPLELAQLASAINQLSGGGGGLFDKIREGLGVDDLNVARDEDGTTAVTAGKYITDRVYTDVTVGSDGTSEVQLNYEIRKGFSANTGFDSNGGTGFGLSYELDY